MKPPSIIRVYAHFTNIIYSILYLHKFGQQITISNKIYLSLQSLTFALYLTKPFFPDCDPPDEAVRLIAAVCLCFLCFVNCYSVKWATLVQDVFTYAKVFALIVIIFTGFYMIGIGKTANFNWHGTETDITVIGKLSKFLFIK